MNHKKTRLDLHLALQQYSFHSAKLTYACGCVWPKQSSNKTAVKEGKKRKNLKTFEELLGNEEKNLNFEEFL